VRRLVTLAAAQRDLVSILDDLTRESGSLSIGRGFVDQLRQHCAKLASMPGTLGCARPELRPDIRNSVTKGYVVFFRYRDDALEVVNVLEGHRDWSCQRNPRHHRNSDFVKHSTVA
jgi:toxin ParE1/3/4